MIIDQEMECVIHEPSCHFMDKQKTIIDNLIKTHVVCHLV